MGFFQNSKLRFIIELTELEDGGEEEGEEEEEERGSGAMQFSPLWVRTKRTKGIVAWKGGRGGANKETK